MEYIEREAFLAEQRHLYCDNCARRKNSKGKFVYDIGDAPCRACDIMDVLDAVEDFPAADVRPVVRGEWIPWMRIPEDYVCDKCEWHSRIKTNFCPNCGADMREESLWNLNLARSVVTVTRHTLTNTRKFLATG